MKWAEALMCSGYGAKRLHKAILRAIWAINRAHWNTTCSENAEAIKIAGEVDLLTKVNDVIQRNHRNHTRAPLRLDTLLQRRDEILQRRSDEWHEEREQQLRDETHERYDGPGNRVAELAEQSINGTAGSEYRS